MATIPAFQQSPFQLLFHMQEALRAAIWEKEGLPAYSAGPRDNGDKLPTTLLKLRKMQGVYGSKKMIQAQEDCQKHRIIRSGFRTNSKLPELDAIHPGILKALQHTTTELLTMLPSFPLRQT